MKKYYFRLSATIADDELLAALAHPTAGADWDETDGFREWAVPDFCPGNADPKEVASAKDSDPNGDYDYDALYSDAAMAQDAYYRAGAGMAAMDDFSFDDVTLALVVRDEEPRPLETIIGMSHLQEYLKDADPVDREQWLKRLGSVLRDYSPEAADALETLGKYK